MDYQNRVIQYPKEYSLCTGCMSCELICALVHDGKSSPSRTRIKLELDNTKHMIQRIAVCQQCENHPCYEACPKKDKALCIDETTGIVYVNEDECIGCGKCAKACHFEDPRIYIVKTDGKKHAIKCDLCRGIEGGPQCVKWCPASCIGLSDESTANLARPLSAEEGE